MSNKDLTAATKMLVREEWEARCRKHVSVAWVQAHETGMGIGGFNKLVGGERRGCASANIYFQLPSSTRDCAVGGPGQLPWAPRLKRS